MKGATKGVSKSSKLLNCLGHAGKRGFIYFVSLFAAVLQVLKNKMLRVVVTVLFKDLDISDIQHLCILLN